MEPTQKTTKLIIIEEAPTVEKLANATLLEVNEEAASPAEVQNVEETASVIQAASEAKEDVPSKETAAKSKKAPVDTKICTE